MCIYNQLKINLMTKRKNKNGMAKYRTATRISSLTIHEGEEEELTKMSKEPSLLVCYFLRV